MKKVEVRQKKFFGVSEVSHGEREMGVGRGEQELHV